MISKVLGWAGANKLTLALGLGAIVLFVVFLGVYGSMMKERGRNEAVNEQLKQAIDKFNTEAGNIRTSADNLNGAIAAAAKIRPKVIEKYTTYVEKNPLPVGCLLDDGRMQAIAGGVGSANALRPGSGGLRSPAAAPIDKLGRPGS